MTQFYYLSSKTPLETGVIGEVKKKSKKGHMTIESRIDEASITVKLLDGEGPGNLSYPYQYEVFANVGDFGANTTILNEFDQKCLNTLLVYVIEALKESFVIEWFTAWAGEENQEPVRVTEIAKEELAVEAMHLQNLEKLRIYRQIRY
ncbi:hypothetical protein [Sporosarcina sp. Te-1]|uniref:hypothetical protein n=1 Tax=Sporosarcina sp. Te-1 TaxID=2818390 RepID=UPI001A9D73BA|nr:hypothetical protein [Sporosarcina sp. Te-1]QTD41899.1 hypothetical protein J3U78_03330 [Sporosarcina sp. Te-1]